MLRGSHCLFLMSSFFLKTNTKSKTLRNSYVTFSLKRCKINRKKGNKKHTKGMFTIFIKMAMVNRKGNQPPVTKFSNFPFKNIVITIKTTYKTHNYMLFMNECSTDYIFKVVICL